MRELQQRLHKFSKKIYQDVVPIENFNEIIFKNVTFYYDTNLFSVGPLNLKIKSGEINFIIGNNGSGKSTFLKLLTALYFPQKGNITVDGLELSKSNVQNYRCLFSTIFDDFHLFEKLYGIDEYNSQELQEMLQIMKLEHKVKIDNGKFNTLQLSTGQKKRLGLVVTMLENKPICIFDEWAADQDPEFRHYFYEKVLPKFKQQGKTIIAVSHDDRYFHIADKVISLKDGILQEIL